MIDIACVLQIEVNIPSHKQTWNEILGTFKTHLYQVVWAPQSMSGYLRKIVVDMLIRVALEANRYLVLLV